jgi:uncharacterized membrane protein YphA (DoxX/SURF4 family)
MMGRPRTNTRIWGWAAAAAAMASGVALAHERFVKHNLKNPMHDDFFLNLPKWGKFGMHPDYVRVGINSFVVLFMFLLIWFLRQPIEEMALNRVFRPIGPKAHRIAHSVASFLTDKPVKGSTFYNLGEWALIWFLRIPGLVLIFSATLDSLVMPSFPLDPTSAAIFKYAQVILAILILTQTLLPLCGALIFGTFLYLFKWGWSVALDALPVVTPAVVYISSPWSSHKISIGEPSVTQMAFIRRILGFGFFALGFLKIWNHDLLMGVGDNYPEFMEDPLVKFFSLGTDPYYRRETFVTSFALAEVVSGFMLTIGVFTRIWASIMAFVFAKLLFVNFGFAEMPHFFPIGGCLSLIFSNKLTSEFDWVEEKEERAGREGKRALQAIIIVGSALVVAFVTIFPMMYALSFTDRATVP